MATQNIPFVQIENYIRDLIIKSGCVFNRDEILNASKEWMEKYPVEFNSILNLIENESSRIDDDSTPSVAFHGAYADDSTPSVAHYEEYSGNIMPDHMSSVSDSPMGTEQIDSSPGGYSDELESDMPFQRTMSHGPPRN
jgi:hypothetical protein